MADKIITQGEVPKNLSIQYPTNTANAMRDTNRMHKENDKAKNVPKDMVLL
jgi:hypothetical protein